VSALPPKSSLTVRFATFASLYAGNVEARSLTLAVSLSHSVSLTHSLCVSLSLTLSVSLSHSVSLTHAFRRAASNRNRNLCSLSLTATLLHALCKVALPPTSGLSPLHHPTYKLPSHEPGSVGLGLAQLQAERAEAVLGGERGLLLWVRQERDKKHDTKCYWLIYSVHRLSQQSRAALGWLKMRRLDWEWMLAWLRAQVRELHVYPEQGAPSLM
jgi:hypothetical protein